jgi:hypothetical protein
VGSNPAAPTIFSFENKENSVSRPVGPQGGNGTEGRRSAGSGTKSPEIVPNRIPQSFSAELRDLAHAVRRIGCGLRTDPESIAICKDEIAVRLTAIARQLAGAV